MSRLMLAGVVLALASGCTTTYRVELQNLLPAAETVTLRFENDEGYTRSADPVAIDSNENQDVSVTVPNDRLPGRLVWITSDGRRGPAYNVGEDSDTTLTFKVDQATTVGTAPPLLR